MNKNLRTHIFACLTMLWCLTTAQAQTGSIVGSIQSERGTALTGMSVGLEGTMLGATTDDAGAFRIDNIPPGVYTLVARGLGYTASKQNVTVTSGRTLDLELALSESDNTLQEIVVSGQTTKYKTDGISTSLHLNTPLIETPQNIIGVSSTTLRDQQGFSLNDVARNVSGINITSQHSALAPNFRIRGTTSNSNSFRNGVRGMSSFNQVEDLAIIDRVEFVKGPGGFLISSGEPGGSYNVVTKQATGQKIREANFSVGSYNLLRGAIDIGGKMGRSGLSYRFNAAAYNQDAMMKYVGLNRYTIAPVLKYDFDEKTSLTAEYNYSFSKVIGTTDLSVSSVNGQTHVLPNDFSYQDPNIPGGAIIDHFGRLALEHQLNDKWKFTAQVAYRDYHDDEVWFLDATGGTPIVDANGIIERHVNYYIANANGAYGQMFLSGKVNTGKVHHDILIGYDAAQLDASTIYTQGARKFLLDTKNPKYGLQIDSLLDLTIPSDPTRTANTWSAGFVQDQFKLFDRLIVSVGGRYTFFTNTTGKGAVVDKIKTFSPRGGLTYLINQKFSVYGMYDRAFIPQTGRDFEGNAFEPIRGNSVEFGLKKEWFDGLLMTNLVGFRINRTNSLVPDPIRANFNVATGEIQIQGIELDIIGNITNNISVVANYAYTDGKTISDPRPERIGLRPRGIAEHLANAWLKYTFTQSAVRGLGVAIGGTFMGERSAAATENLNVPSYTKFDASLFYVYNNLSFNFNLDNLANTKYMVIGNRLNATTTVYVPGLPTNFRMSVGVRF